MSEENSKLWDKLKTPPEKYTKKFRKAGGFSGTNIDPTWRAQVMTEVFGPVGKGWGWEIQDRWREEYHSEEGEAWYVFVQVRVWYLIDGEECWTGPQIGGTDTRIPDEGYKMAITDALGKCLLSIGVGAAVYLGEFDNKYGRPQADSGGESAPSQQGGALPNCPTCGKALRKSNDKPEYYCWKKKEGCGFTSPMARFKDGKYQVPSTDNGNESDSVVELRSKIDTCSTMQAYQSVWQDAKEAKTSGKINADETKKVAAHYRDGLCLFLNGRILAAQDEGEFAIVFTDLSTLTSEKVLTEARYKTLKTSWDKRKAEVAATVASEGMNTPT